MGASNEPFGFNMGMMLTRVRIISSTQNGPEYLYEALDYVAKGKVKVVGKPTNSTKSAKPMIASQQARCASGQ
jgi:hypothetical protein